MLKGETTTAAGGTCTAPTETCCGRHIRACPSPTSMGTPHAAPSTLWPYGDRQDRRLRWATPWREPLPGWSRGQAAAAAGAARGEGGGGKKGWYSLGMSNRPAGALLRPPSAGNKRRRAESGAADAVEGTAAEESPAFSPCSVDNSAAAADPIDVYVIKSNFDPVTREISPRGTVQVLPDEVRAEAAARGPPQRGGGGGGGGGISCAPGWHRRGSITFPQQPPPRMDEPGRGCLDVTPASQLWQR